MYGPLSTLFLDADRPCAPEDELAWYIERLPATGGPALDVMCGAGRMLVPLTARGCNVHGIDLSASMLARCEEKLAAAGLSAAAFRQDIVHMNLPFRYGCAFIAGGAFGLLADARAAVAALERIRAHLVDPGVLLIDCRVPPASVQRLGAPLVEVRTMKLADGTQITLRSEATWSSDARLARAVNRYAHRRGSLRLAEEHGTVTSTWYSPNEIVEVVRAAGFRDVTTGPSAVRPEGGDAFAVTALL
jgi:ubiquinone/menaquinone biosynthesis C-methylase UbiE